MIFKGRQEVKEEKSVKESFDRKDKKSEKNLSFVFRSVTKRCEDEEKNLREKKNGGKFD